MSDELPQGWARVSLAQLVAFNPKHSSDVPDSAPVTFVPMASVSESSPELEKTTTVRPLGEVRKGYTHFAERDVLFAKITPCMENGKGAVASGLVNGLGCGTTELVVMRSLGAIEPHVLYRFLAQPSVRRAAKENFTGTAGQARVPLSFLEELEIPLPPLAEQRRIVAKLEEVLGKVDATRARLAKIPALLKRFRQSVLAAACSGRLTADWREKQPKPDDWQETEFGELVQSSFYGPRFGAEDYTGKGVPTIRTTDMDFRGNIDVSEAPRMELSAEQLRRFGLVDGDLLVTRTGATIGKCAIYSEKLGPALPSAYLIRFRLKKELIEPRFALARMLSPEGQALLQGGSTAVAQPNVNATTIQMFPLSLPPLAEQREIVRRVEALFALADKLEARFQRAQAQVEKLTASVLARAFAGRLVPQDPADEPAAVLLERLRAGHASFAEAKPAGSRRYPEPEPRELKVAEAAGPKPLQHRKVRKPAQGARQSAD